MIAGLIVIFASGLWLHERFPVARGSRSGGEPHPTKEAVERAQREAARAAEHARKLYESWRRQ